MWVQSKVTGNPYDSCTLREIQILTIHETICDLYTRSVGHSIKYNIGRRREKRGDVGSVDVSVFVAPPKLLLFCDPSELDIPEFPEVE